MPIRVRIHKRQLRTPLQFQKQLDHSPARYLIPSRKTYSSTPVPVPVSCSMTYNDRWLWYWGKNPNVEPLGDPISHLRDSKHVYTICLLNKRKSDMLKIKYGRKSEVLLKIHSIRVDTTLRAIGLVFQMTSQSLYLEYFRVTAI